MTVNALNSVVLVKWWQLENTPETKKGISESKTANNPLDLLIEYVQYISSGYLIGRGSTATFHYAMEHILQSSKVYK